MRTPEIQSLANEAYIWFDYFSIPQTSYVSDMDNAESGNIAAAAASHADAALGHSIAAGSAGHQTSGAGNGPVVSHADLASHGATGAEEDVFSATLRNLGKAVNSIPAYVDAAEVLLALNPLCLHQDSVRCPIHTLITETCMLTHAAMARGPLSHYDRTRCSEPPCASPCSCGFRRCCLCY